MAEQHRSQRPSGGKPSGSKPSGGKSYGGKPSPGGKPTGGKPSPRTDAASRPRPSPASARSAGAPTPSGRDRRDTRGAVRRPSPARPATAPVARTTGSVRPTSRPTAPPSRALRRSGDPRGDHRCRARPLGDRPAQGSAGEAGQPGRPAPRRRRHAHRRGPRDRLPARHGRSGARAAARRRARGGRRGGVRRRSLRGGARRAARGEADERRDGVPADHGGLPPRPRQAAGGAEAGQEPVGRELRARAEGGDDDRRGRCSSRPRPARRCPAHPGARAAAVEEPRLLGGAAALRLRGHPRGGRPRARTRSRGSTGRTRSTPTSSPTPTSGPRRWRSASAEATQA